MKKIYLTLSFVIATGLLSAQNKHTKTADKLFERYEYVDAAQEYLKLTQEQKNELFCRNRYRFYFNKNSCSR